MGLGPRADDRAGAIAYGDLKKLELAIALAGEPALLLLDEPAAGMAPAERRALMALEELYAEVAGGTSPSGPSS